MRFKKKMIELKEQISFLFYILTNDYSTRKKVINHYALYYYAIGVQCINAKDPFIFCRQFP